MSQDRNQCRGALERFLHLHSFYTLDEYFKCSKYQNSCYCSSQVTVYTQKLYTIKAEYLKIVQSNYIPKLVYKTFNSLADPQQGTLYITLLLQAITYIFFFSSFTVLTILACLCIDMFCILGFTTHFESDENENKLN